MGKALMRISILGILNNKIQNYQLPKQGFTLIELSLVILVIGLVLALVLPNLGTPKAKLEKEREIERISQTIKYLYNLSQVQNEKICLLFDLNGNKFWAISLPAEEDDERINQLAALLASQTEDYLVPEKRLRSSLKVKDIINFKGSKITEGIVSLIFHPSGFVEPATIHFIDEKETFYTLFINPLTGQSHVELGYLEEE